MSVFHDYDPEDAWDAGDDRGEHIHNLIERLELLDDHLLDPLRTTPIGDLEPNVLDEIEAHVRRQLALRNIDPRDAERIRQILDDITTTRQQ